LVTEKKRTEQRCLEVELVKACALGPQPLLGLANSQQSVNASFGKVVCELKAAELDFPSSVPKTGLYKQGIQAVSINLKSRVIEIPGQVVLT
jgi:hypothetical protein